MISRLNADTLPDVLPIFPLTGSILLPKGSLPLNIFEPRYVEMVKDALQTDHKLIGMIQPKIYGSRELMDVGCAGKIMSYNETSDGRYSIVLGGIARFKIKEEMNVTTLYRQVNPNWAPFTDDMPKTQIHADVCRKDFLQCLQAYSDALDFEIDVDEIEHSNEEIIINMLANYLPFCKTEKQALVEAKTLTDRVKTMTKLMMFAISTHGTHDGSMQ